MTAMASTTKAEGIEIGSASKLHYILHSYPFAALIAVTDCMFALHLLDLVHLYHIGMDVCGMYYVYCFWGVSGLFTFG